MFRNYKLLKRFPLSIKGISKKCSSKKSALLIPGRIGSNFTPTVMPYINVEEHFTQKIDKIKQSLVLRGTAISEINLEKFVAAGTNLRKIDSEVEHLDSRREEIKKDFTKIDDQLVLTKLQEEAKVIKSSLKQLRRHRWKLEETVLIEYLRLPNILHDSTPTDSEDQILEEFGNKPELDNEDVRGHMELIRDHIDFSSKNPSSGYYLLDVMAELEVTLTWAIQDFLLQAGLNMFSGPDFTRSAIVEGCDPNTDFFSDDSGKENVFSLAPTSDFGDVSSLAGTHLVGSASLESFIGQFVKNIIVNPQSSLPITYFSCGRKYKPIKNVHLNTKDSLYTTQQSTAIELCCVASSASSLQEQLKYIQTFTKEFYSLIGLHCRIVKRHAGNINHAAQNMKLSILVYSPHVKDYIEVGHFGIYGDFLSRRLMLLSEDGNRYKDLHILSGTFMNVTKMMGCIIESSQIYCDKMQKSKMKEILTKMLKSVSDIQLHYTSNINSSNGVHL